MTIRNQYGPRLTPPPTTGDSRVDVWLRQVADAVNGLPRLSVFSYSTPESNVTASPGTLGFNEASNHTRVWLKETGNGTTGWVSVVTA